MLGALIGLGIASAAYSVYRQHKSDTQIDRSNDINEQAAQLNYKAQQETNEMNYRIFQEQQNYNSPVHLKEMYDSLGLNGSAIVANQGFTPTSAPQMLAPRYDQVSFTPYAQPENPADKMMQSLISALTSSKMRAEIENTIKDSILKEAQTQNCQKSTEVIAQDVLLKGLDVKLKQNDLDTLNEKNAELRLTVQRLQQDVEYQPKLQKAVLRQYDDKHALDVADEIIKKLEASELGLNVRFLRESLGNRLQQVFQSLQNSIKQGESFDLSNDAAQIANYIAYETRQGIIDAENASNRNTKASENYSASKIEAASSGTDGQPIENGQDFANRCVWTFGIIADALVSPLKGIVKIK